MLGILGRREGREAGPRAEGRLLILGRRGPVVMDVSRAGWTFVGSGGRTDLRHEQADRGRSGLCVLVSLKRDSSRRAVDGVSTGGCVCVCCVDAPTTCSHCPGLCRSREPHTESDSISISRQCEPTGRGRFWGRACRCSFRLRDWPGANRDSSLDARLH